MAPKLEQGYLAVISLQDFTVLSTNRFRRYEIQSLSVIFLPTKSPMERVLWHTIHW